MPDSKPCSTNFCALLGSISCGSRKSSARTIPWRVRGSSVRQPHVHNLTDRTLKMNKIIIGCHSSTMPGVESSIDKASPNYSNILTSVWLWVLSAMGDTNSLYQQLFVASIWLAKMLQIQPLQNSYYLSYGGASSQSCCNFYDKTGFIACITNLYVNGYIMDWSDRSAMSPDEPVCLDMGDDGSLFLWIRPLS